MALDGIAIASIVNELKNKLIGGKIDKVYQPEHDEITLSIRNAGNNFKLLLTANASHPRVHITKTSKSNPMQAPLFCMVLRKHLLNGKITAISQPDFERIINITVESVNELGDLTQKVVVTEIMGKHSNIILLDENGAILDSVKHVSFEKSSVREVLPGKAYIMPPSQGKKNPCTINNQEFIDALSLSKQSVDIHKFIYGCYSGISPVISAELCHRSNIMPSCAVEGLTGMQKTMLYKHFKEIIDETIENKFCYEIIYDEKGSFLDFSSIELLQYSNLKKENFNNPSDMLELYYAERDAKYHILQKSQDLRKLVATNIERLVKKRDIQEKSLDDIKGRDKWKLYGELITANIYAVKKGMKEFTTVNFYDENMPEITIPIDKDKTPSENAQKYFKRYNKEKRTFEALQIQIKQAIEEFEYLEGVLNASIAATDIADLDEIRSELAEQGYAKKKHIRKGAQQKKKSKPINFVSSDGFNIYVGKSNMQNDELTLRFANPDDIWLHTKKIPGSHVIIRTEGKLPSSTTIEEAAQIAAYFSKAKASSLVPVDYTQKRNVKKPNGARPGMVIYDNYKTAYVTPHEAFINTLRNEK